jgi:anti-anti-sigma factor
MGAKKKPKSAVTALCIEGELTIFRAAELKPVLLDPSQSIEVDLSGVSDIDTAGLQLLMMAKKAAQAQDRCLRLVRHSPAVTELFERLNVTAWFGDPLVIEPRGDAAPKRHPKSQSTGY